MREPSWPTPGDMYLAWTKIGVGMLYAFPGLSGYNSYFIEPVEYSKSSGERTCVWHFVTAIPIFTSRLDFKHHFRSPGPHRCYSCCVFREQTEPGKYRETSRCRMRRGNRAARWKTVSGSFSNLQNKIKTWHWHLIFFYHIRLQGFSPRVDNFSVSTVAKAAASLAPMYISEWFDKGPKLWKTFLSTWQWSKTSGMSILLGHRIWRARGSGKLELNLQFFCNWKFTQLLRASISLAVEWE